MVYGVAHGEIASINCSVRANPDDDLDFTWTFNSSSELNTLPENRFRTKGSTSQVKLNKGCLSFPSHVSDEGFLTSYNYHIAKLLVKAAEFSS